MLKKICSICTNVYYPNSNNSKYCSDRCKKDSVNSKRRNEVRNLICPICKTEFKTSNSKKKYCSGDCNLTAKATHRTKPQLEKVCKYCLTPFFAEGKKRQAVYCGKDCRAKDWKRDYIEKVCPNCKKKFWGDKRQTCCSRACSNNYNSKQIKLECQMCSNEFYVIPARLKKDVKPKFCSEVCYRKSRRTGKKPNCTCDYCGKSRYKAPSLLKKHRFTFCSHECMGKYYEQNKLFSGENNGAYIGSVDKHGKYYGSNWLQQRRNARKRDKYSCQKCGIYEKDYGMELSIHHIIPFVLFDDYLEANELNNLLSVCEPCHRKIHSGDNHPTKFKIKYKENKPSN